MIVSLYTLINVFKIASIRDTLLSVQVICTIVVPLLANDVDILFLYMDDATSGLIRVTKTGLPI